MELRRYVALLWRWQWFILLTALVAGVATYLINRSQPSIYQASTTLLVNAGSADLTNLNAIRTSEQLAFSYVTRLANLEVLTQALANLNLDMLPSDLKENIEISLVNNTQLISLRVNHPDPQIARDLANEIPKVFAERNIAQQLERFALSKISLEENLAELQTELAAAEAALDTEMSRSIPNQRAIDQTNNNIFRLNQIYTTLLQSYEEIRLSEVRSLDTIVIDESASLPQEPIGPRIMMNSILALVAGAVVAASFVFLFDYLDDTLKDLEDIESVVGLSVLGVIKRMRVEKPVDVLVVAMEPRSPTAEAYRQLRTNIQFADVDHRLNTILVTSTNMGDGKSTIAINLAATLAQSGKRVILVDADMRRPTLHKILGLDDNKGLSDLIVRSNEDCRFIKNTIIHNLLFLPAGRIPPNPAELIGSNRMKEIACWLEKQADHVIIDSPPLLAVTDAAILSQLADTTLLVVSANGTRRPALIEAVKKLQALDSHIAGVLLNKVNPRRSNGHYYYYRDDYKAGSQNGRYKKASKQNRL